VGLEEIVGGGVVALKLPGKEPLCMYLGLCYIPRRGAEFLAR
jgi:hypothetical protein